ncbi:MAG TPA: hypothetical protein VGW78_01400 [Candidatus Babeliales bacterium]|jgi:hypothetical protein|nr:hypothetical protein [Candidatus Babeliales bacterium]
MKSIAALVIGISLNIMAMETPATGESIKDLTQENTKLKAELSKYKNQAFRYQEQYHNMVACAGIAWTIIALESLREWYKINH